MDKGTKILVTGSSGQLGNELQDLSKTHPQFEFIFLSSHQLSIANKEAVIKAFEKYHPNYLINCGAYTNVDNAEAERDKAMEVNAIAVGQLAQICNQFHTKFIHISTDYVFDGAATSPLKETDDVNPVNFYGESKLTGEMEAIKNNPEVIIIRTSWVYSTYGKNFVKTMLRLLNEREVIQVVNDQVGSPTYANDLAEVILQIITGDNWVPGIYHFSNEGHISWFEFAMEIKNKVNSTCEIIPVATSEFYTKAKRPAYSVLDKTKIQHTFHIKLKNWKESLNKCLSQLNEEH